MPSKIIQNLFFSSLAVLLLLNPLFFACAQQSDAPKDSVEIYVFYLETCPYCQQAKTFLATLKQKYPSMVIREYEVSEEQNRELLAVLSSAYNRDFGGVPIVFVADEATEGFNDNIGAQIELKVKNCVENGCPTPMQKVQDKFSSANQAATDESNIKNLAIRNWETTILFFSFIASVVFLLVFFIVKRRRASHKI